MARPLFTICCQSCSVDQDTNMLSVFHILEGLDLTVDSSTAEPIPKDTVAILEEKKKNPRLRVPSLSFVGISVWCRDKFDTADQEYEFEVLLAKPGEDEPMVVETGRLKFIRRAHRFMVHFDVNNPWNKSGECRFEVRLRKPGKPEWLSQDYLFEVSVYRNTSQATSG